LTSSPDAPLLSSLRIGVRRYKSYMTTVTHN